MSALGQSLLVAAIMIGAMSAVFACGIPGLALALVGIVIGLLRVVRELSAAELGTNLSRK